MLFPFFSFFNVEFFWFARTLVHFSNATTFLSPGLTYTIGPIMIPRGGFFVTPPKDTDGQHGLSSFGQASPFDKRFPVARFYVFHEWARFPTQNRTFSFPRD